MKTQGALWVAGVVLLAVTGGFHREVSAERLCEQWVSRIVSIQGKVLVKRRNETQWKVTRPDAYLCPGDRLRVEKNSRAAVVLCDASVLRVDQSSTLVFTPLGEEKNLLIRLLEGAVRFFSRQPHRLKVVTPFVNGVLRGTEFVVRVEADRTRIILFEGRLLVENDAGSLLMAPGQATETVAGHAPRQYTVVRPQDAVTWALHYPPLMAFRPDDFPPSDFPEGHTSISAFVRGDLTEAFEALKGIDSREIDDPQFFLYQAGLFLTVGRIREAMVAIDTADLRGANRGESLALKAAIAVVQNRQEAARDLADRALAADQRSATAWLAASYVHQADFNLHQALLDVRRAVAVAPDNPLAWARLAELRLSMGNHTGALAAAKEAAGIEPRLARTQSVLGYAYLTRIQLDEALQAFAAAIDIDSSAPLPRLGMGLARIRQGDLHAGRADLEIAVSLDPNNSLLRSYLGKAYFDETRDDLDARQFEIAKRLDPNDPTPWLYDALRKQSVNRPVAALQDLERSIALNDNRVVYRSRFLLDQDLATRSAHLGKIYNELGFGLRALAEGWHSVNTDPSNYSAHRFLADSYAVLPRHEIARVSEVLQAQLLQPTSIAPVSPRLAESKLLIREGMGTVNPAFNEFGQLYNRNRMALNAVGVLGENNTLGTEIVPSLVWNNFSASLGRFHFESDGFRTNNDQELDIIDLFTHLSLSPKASILAQYRNSDKEHGDLPLRFDPALFFATDRYRDEASSMRIGGQYTFSPDARFIGTLVFGDTSSKVAIPDFGWEDKIEDNGYRIEGQQHLRMNRWHFVGGIGYFEADRTETITLDPWPGEVEKRDLTHTNLYLYTHIDGPGHTRWTIGASGDFFEERIAGSDQFNPKFGVIWHPIAGTTLRGAVFRTLERTMIFKQTIEPTQVAGFNQFFDDYEGTDARHYGLAWDQRFTQHVYGGLTLSRRDMDVPWGDASDPPVQARSAQWDELIYRGYLYWAPNARVALSAEYRYEDLNRDPEYPGDSLFRSIQTHRIPLGVNYFHPTGWIGRITAIHVRQEGRFGDPNSGFDHGSDSFWVVGAGVSFRLPKRRGMITLESRNLLDPSFRFQDTDPANPDISPERTLLIKVNLSL